MKKYLVISFVAGLFVGISFMFLYTGIRFGSNTSLYAEDGYIKLQSYGILRATNFEASKKFKQIFIFSSMEGTQNKIIMLEGLEGLGGIIFMPAKYLDVVSADNNQLVAKNDIWTVTFLKDKVSLVDKDGKSGELVSDLIGR